MNLKEIVKNRRDYRAAVIGMLLGDGCVFATKSKKECLFCMTHCPKQLEYMQFKSDVLLLNPTVKMYFSSRKTVVANKTFFQYQAMSNSNRFFSFMKRIFYKPNKCISYKLLRNLTPFGIYLWYLDDGSLLVRKDLESDKIKEYRIILYTSSFTLDEVKTIRSYFFDTYNISPNINKKEGHYVLYFNGAKTREFMKIIDPYYDCVECMKYKFLKYYFD